MVWYDQGTTNGTWSDTTCGRLGWSDNSTTSTSATTDYIYYPLFVVTTSAETTMTVSEQRYERGYERRLTADEQRAQAEQEAARILAEAERAKARKAAQERAKHLLLEHLTADQRATFERNGWFVVEGGKSRKQYRIEAQAHAGNVIELDGAKHRYRYCCHVDYSFPAHDNALAQKLMIEHDEDTFIRLANRRAA